MNEKDLFGILHIIDSLGELNGRKRIQKMVCIGKYNPEVNYPFSFQYIKYLYGPYSFDLKETIDRFVVLGIIKEEKNVGYRYSLTDEGIKILKQLSGKVKKEDKNKLKFLISNYPATMDTSNLVAESKKFFI